MAAGERAATRRAHILPFPHRASALGLQAAPGRPDLTLLLLHCPALENLALEGLWGGPWGEVEAVYPDGIQVLPKLKNLQFSSNIYGAGSFHLRLGEWMVKTNAGLIEEFGMPWLCGVGPELDEIVTMQWRFLRHIRSTLETIGIICESADDGSLRGSEDDMFCGGTFVFSARFEAPPFMYSLLDQVKHQFGQRHDSQHRKLMSFPRERLQGRTLPTPKKGHVHLPPPREHRALESRRHLSKTRIGPSIAERFENFEDPSFDLFIDDHPERKRSLVHLRRRNASCQIELET